MRQVLDVLAGCPEPAQRLPNIRKLRGIDGREVRRLARGHWRSLNKDWAARGDPSWKNHAEAKAHEDREGGSGPQLLPSDPQLGGNERRGRVGVGRQIK